MKRLFVIVLFLLLSAGLCAAASKKPPASVDACSLLSSASVEKMLGEKIQSPKMEGSEQPQPEAMNAALSNCTWATVAQKNGMPKRSLYLWIRQAPAAVNDSSQVMEGLRLDPKTHVGRPVEALTDFGESAFWMSGKANGTTRLEMDAMKKDLVVQVVLTGFDDAIAAESQAKGAIESVWKKLGVS